MSAPARRPLYGTPGVPLQNSDELSVTAPPVMAWILAASQVGAVLLTRPYLAGLAYTSLPGVFGSSHCTGWSVRPSRSHRLKGI